MAIKVEHGEHNFRKPACLEYCFIDREYCPLYKMSVGESGSTKPLSLKIRRWTDLQEEKSYEIDYSGKMGPEDQLPKLTPENVTKVSPPKIDTDKIPDYDEKIKNEHESFTPFSCWGDGSGFEYDIMPENLIGPSGPMEHLYDLSYYKINTNPLQLSDWNTWVDKFQIDYRFAQVSDLNAETVLFPNVDDPWMFTEYIFKGTGSGEVIVEPPLYDEETLQLKNADMVLDSTSEEVLAKYDERIEKEKVKFVKSYRQVCHWDELNTKEDRRSLTNFSVPDSGGKLYRVDVPVESVKWGEHGNIPPNTINMGAPEDWMDITKSAAKIHPKYVAHIGTPYYANSYGVVYWKDNDAYIDETTPTQLSSEDGDSNDPMFRAYLTYPVKEFENDTPPGVKQNTPMRVLPQNTWKKNGVKLANTYLPTGSLSHGGCQMLKSKLNTNTSGICYCEAISTLAENDPELTDIKSHFKWENCSKENKSCPKFVSGPEYPILADFQSVAYDRAQFNEQVLGIYSGEDADQRAWADNLLKNSTGLPTADMFLAMGFGTSGKMGRPDVYNPTEVSVWYEAQFEVVYESEDPVQLNKQLSDGNGFGKGVQVLRGTGKMALDTYENSNAFRGDTVFFGDMDQRGFSRWFETPMFCAKAAYCNDICGISMQSGWDPIQRAGSSEGSCRYYRSANTKGARDHIGCPTTCVQKRAYEFQQTIKICSPIIISLGEMWLKMTSDEWIEYNENRNNTYYFEKNDGTSIQEEIEEDIEERNATPTIWKIWSRSESISTMGGVYAKEKKKDPVPKKEEEQDEDIKDIQLIAKVRISNLAVEGFFWYQSMDNAGAAKDVWFCKCDLHYTEFKRNTLIITNEDKFIGGYHPQYKDYSKIGPEYLMDVESDSYRDAMGDIIGDVDHDGQPQAINKQGYWTDQSGDYIVDEASTGIDVPIKEDEARKNAGSPITISLKKSNTFVDGETGEMKQPKTVNCAVHSNDPYSLMETYAAGHLNENGKMEGRPMFEDDSGDGKRYWAPPNIHNRWALPTMRMAAYCPKCDYYLAYRFHDLLCPWCGTRLQTITGDKGEGMEVKSTWSESASVIRKFFKLNAIGKVQVWAPPGTCVPLNGYYWKNPTVVTNTLINQIKYRLGSFSGNSWQGDGMSAAKEFSLGYPEQLGYYIPIPNFKDEESDSLETYGSIKWEGVSLENRKRYASYNDIMPKNPLPGFVTDKVNESVIVPYTSVSGDGLKMITVSEIIALRNRIEPVLAYCSELPSQNDYPRMRASYEKRIEENVPRYISKAHCRVPSVILAANDSGIDSYVQFYSGDPEWGSVREYYPPGMSWWWLNQLIGGRYSDLTGGHYHMDGKEQNGSPWRYSGGNRTISKCAMFIHGVLPLDKEIMAAYLILDSAGEPYKEPIGRGWNGHIHYDHFHAMTEKHFNDGQYAHLHGQAGFKGEFDSEGNYTEPNYNQTHLSLPQSPIVPQDESDYYKWAKDSNRPKNYQSLYVSNFLQEWTGLPGVRDEGFWKQYGKEKANGNTSEDPIDVYEGDLSKDLVPNKRKQSSKFDSSKFGYVGVDDNGDLRQNVSSDDIWHDYSEEEFKEDLERSTVQSTFSASDGSKEDETTADFEQYAEKFSEEYFDVKQNASGYYSSDDFDIHILVDAPSFTPHPPKDELFDKPTIGEDYPPQSPSNDGGTPGNSKRERNNQRRVFDITELIRKLYNTRIERRYYCQAGKTLKEVSQIKFEDPRWEGVGEWEKQDEAKKWNEQKNSNGKFKGYLLNDDFSMPKLDADRSIPGTANEGDQYELQPSGIQIVATFMIPFTIKEGSNHYLIVSSVPGKKQEEEDIKSLESGKRVTTTKDVQEILSEMFPGFDVSITSSSSCLIKKENPADGESLEIKECAGSCYGYFSFPTGNISGHQDRVVSATSFVTGYHPTNLALDNPCPWITNSYIFETQNAIFDLCRAPLEDYEKNYRYQAPSVNCSSCKCPNADCETNGLTVGVYAERKGIKFTDGQTACPGCGTDLSGQPGAVVINGDGLYSWYYQESFAENPFITGFSIGVVEKMSFRVSCKNSENDAWSSLLNVVYDASNEKYTYYFNGKTEEKDSIPTEFSLNEKNWKRARYIQIEIDPQELEETIAFEEEDLTQESEYALKAAGNFQNYGLFDWSGIKCEVSGTDEDNFDSTAEIQLSTVSMNDEKTELTFYFKNKISMKKVQKLIIKPKKYTSTVNFFKVYGFHYKPSDLTMTGNAQEKTFLFSAKKRIYQLEEFPTQILSVSIGKNESGGIELTEVDSKDELSYTLTVKKVKVINDKGEYEEKGFYAIQSGNYFFDPNHNRLFLPDSGTVKENGKSGEKILLRDFENGIKHIKENISFYPTKLTIRYWTGSGEPVTLEAVAEKQGPSYQVEKDTITVIENIKTLPDNGLSAKMPDMHGKVDRRKIPWVCYNHTPATLSYAIQTLTEGYFKLPILKSTDLGKNVDNDQYFKDLFGKNQTGVVGLCRSEITFYGAPEQVLSGTIWVKAPAYTTKIIDTGTSLIETHERTGGIENGCFIVKVKINPCKGRKTLAWKKPVFVIYARERNPSESL